MANHDLSRSEHAGLAPDIAIFHQMIVWTVESWGMFHEHHHDHPIIPESIITQSTIIYWWKCSERRLPPHHSIHEWPWLTKMYLETHIVSATFSASLDPLDPFPRLPQEFWVTLALASACHFSGSLGSSAASTKSRQLFSNSAMNLRNQAPTHTKTTTYLIFDPKSMNIPSFLLYELYGHIWKKWWIWGHSVCILEIPPTRSNKVLGKSVLRCAST